RDRARSPCGVREHVVAAHRGAAARAPPDPGDRCGAGESRSAGPLRRHVVGRAAQRPARQGATRSAATRSSKASWHTADARRGPARQRPRAPLGYVAAWRFTMTPPTPPTAGSDLPAARLTDASREPPLTGPDPSGPGQRRASRLVGAVWALLIFN